MNQANPDAVRSFLRDAIARGRASRSSRAPLPHADAGRDVPPPRADPDDLVQQFARALAAVNGTPHVVDDEPAARETVCALVQSATEGPILAWDDAFIGLPGLLATLAHGGHPVLPVNLPADPAGRRDALASVAACGVGLTGAAAGIAATGSLVLACGPGRARSTSLLPLVHVAVLRRSTIVATLEAALARQHPLAGPASQTVIITGPSRTGDIEMTLSRGVHGPRDVHVVILQD